MNETELLEAARRGDPGALDELFRRHYDGAVRFAERFAGSDSADDRAAEGFARVYRALLQGQGPETNFRAYLFTAVRNAHVDALRKFGSETPVDGVGSEEAASDDVAESALAAMDATPIKQAFLQLNPAWRTVLWYTVVIGESHAEVARRLGSNANAVGVLAYRAREGLRQAYLAEHVRASTDPACRQVTARLPRFIRDQLPSKSALDVEAHLAGCLHCQSAVRDLTTINQDLGAVLTPALVVALPGSAALSEALGSLHPGGAATATKAAAASLAVTAAAVAVALVLVSGAGPEPTRAPLTSSTASPSTLPPRTLVTAPVVRPSRRSTAPSTPAVPSTSVPSTSVPPGSPPPGSVPPSSTLSPPAPQPSVGGPRVTVGGNDQVRTAAIAVEIVPAGAGGVVVSLSNVASTRVWGDGLQCPGSQTGGAAASVRCSVQRDGPLYLFAQVEFADPGAPVSGTVSLADTPDPDSAGFTARP